MKHCVLMEKINELEKISEVSEETHVHTMVFISSKIVSECRNCRICLDRALFIRTRFVEKIQCEFEIRVE